MGLRNLILCFSNYVGILDSKRQLTAFIAILHPANWISVLGAEAEAIVCGVIICVNDLVLEDFYAVGLLAIIRTSAKRDPVYTKALLPRSGMISLTYNTHHMSMTRADQTSALLPVNRLSLFRLSIRSVCCQHRTSRSHCHYKACCSQSSMMREYLHCI